MHLPLHNEISACTLCADLPLGPRPIFQFSSASKILIVGQAPGRITHHKGRPFDDPSGARLRDWLGIGHDVFYDEAKIALVPMGFCFPGTGKGGDLPPRVECAPVWRNKILQLLTQIELTLIIGRYAIDWHIQEAKNKSVTEIAKDWRQNWPNQLVLPHPSPRNNRWLKLNPWFEAEIVPALRARIKEVLQ